MVKHKIQIIILVFKKHENDIFYVMGHEVGLYLNLDKIRSSSPIMIFIIISYLFNCIFKIYMLGFSGAVYK